MTYSTLATSILSVLSLCCGYGSVFASNPKRRYRCAVAYLLFISAGAACALLERAEFPRLIESGIIAIAMLPVLTMWIFVLNKSNKLRAYQQNLDKLHQTHSSSKFPVNSANHNQAGSKEEILAVQIK